METDHGTRPDAPSGDAGGDSVGVREAAKRLGVNASTVSRQLVTLGIRRAADGKFSYAAYVAARASGLNPLHERGTDAPLADERRSPAPAPSGAGPSIGGQGALHSAHTAEKVWRAASAQLAYEEKLGAVCEKRGAVEAGMKTGEQIQELMRERRRRIAEEVSPLTDPAEIEAVLMREDRLFLRNLEETMKRLLQVTEGANVAAA